MSKARQARSIKAPACSACLAGIFMLMALAVLAGCAGTGGSGKGAAFDRAQYNAVAIHGKLRSEIALTAMGLLGSRYRYGGSSPASGFDCSGFVSYVFGTAGRTALPHNTAMIAEMSHPISRKDLQAGDFVYFNTLGYPNSHMGIFLGDGKFVHAPSSGGRVRIDSMHSAYYAQRFNGVRTVFQL